MDVIGHNFSTVVSSVLGVRQFLSYTCNCSIDSVEHGWANFSDKRPHFLCVNRSRPQSKLASQKSVVCCGLAVDHRDKVISVQIKENNFSRENHGVSKVQGI